ncbi:MAG: hypothetical protein ACYDGM_08850 [Vulcanimicrobiaceae bacterium]
MEPKVGMSIDDELDTLIEHPRGRKKSTSELDVTIERQLEKMRKAVEAGTTLRALAEVFHRRFPDDKEKTIERKIAVALRGAKKPPKRKSKNAAQ